MSGRTPATAWATSQIGGDRLPYPGSGWKRMLKDGHKKAEGSLPPPANLECRLHHLCARSSVHTCTRRARHSSAISHLHRLPSEVHPPSHPIPFQRGRGRREAAQPIVTGTWSTRHSLRRLAVCGPSWSFYSNGWPSRVRAYPNTVELAHQAQT